MNRLLQDNPLGLALCGACGLLLLAMLAMAVASRLSLGMGAESDEVDSTGLSVDLPQLAQAPEIDSFYVITERPLFNESRQPVVEAEVDEDPLADALADADDTELEVELSGVIITPSLRMVTLRRKSAPESLVAFEGRPIEGEFGAWEVAAIEPRAVTLRSAAGRELELQLRVHDQTIEPPPPSARQQQEQADAAAETEAATAEDDAVDRQLTCAEEIRQRIAERREELRRQAEEEDRAGEERAAAEPNSYQQAIRSMIRPTRPNNENEDQR